MDEDKAPLFEMSATAMRVKTIKTSEEIELSSYGSTSKHQSLFELSLKKKKEKKSEPNWYLKLTLNIFYTY